MKLKISNLQLQKIEASFVFYSIFRTLTLIAELILKCRNIHISGFMILSKLMYFAC